MKKLIALILAVVFAATALVSCGNTPDTPDTGDTPDVKDTEAAVDTAPVETWQNTPAFVYDRVVLLGVDGAGAFFNRTDTPNIDRIFADGAVTYEMWSASPSSSAPNWGAMLHGVQPSVHQITNDIAEKYTYNSESAYPSVFRVIREAYPDATLASFSTWEPINYGIIESNIDVHKETADEDAILIEQILDYLEDNDPKMLFVQFDDCDGAGHSTGYGNENHLKQVTTTDEYIGRIYDLYVSLGRAENTLFIVTADHGGTLNGMHGGNSEAEMKNMFAVAGKSIVKGGDIKSLTESGKEWGMEMRDTASVVLYALGLKQPETYTSMVPNNMFEGCITAARPEYVIEYEYAHRTAAGAETPAEDAVAVLGEDRVISYLPFDGSTDDVMGTETSVKGNAKYLAGYYGKAAKMDTYSVRLEDCWPDVDSFSVSMWFNSKGSEGTEALICNRNLSIKNCEGFMLALEPGRIRFCLGDGSTEMNAEFSLPIDYVGGWVNVILAVDRDAGTISLAYDFGDFVTVEIPEELKNASFDGYSGLTVGQDATRGNDDVLDALVDEVIVIDGALTKADVALLAEYYGVK
ncbi:MAG: alkaline phosphatase family protein [Oscillospiraceae bacterium]|nr:alkaline phosphatase family protein [Oscillospiraceae bacterium]